MELITKKEFKVSDNSVQLNKKTLAKYQFSNIRILFNLDLQSWVISYNKKYASTQEIEREIIDEFDQPTGTFETITDTVWLPDRIKPNQSEPVTNEQYLRVEAMIIPSLPEGYTAAQLLTEVSLKGIPIFIELFGFYEGQLTAADFETIR